VTDTTNDTCPTCGGSDIRTTQTQVTEERHGLWVPVLVPQRSCTHCYTKFFDHVSEAIIDEGFKAHVKTAVKFVTDADLERELARREAVREAEAELARITLERRHLPKVALYLELTPKHDPGDCDDVYLNHVGDGKCRRCALLHARRSQYWPASLHITFEVDPQ
jgi:YgiT-type zinc finger domain-containing protein